MRQAKLEDLFDYLPKSKIKAGDGLDEGMFPFYTSSENQTKYMNDFQHYPGCLVFGTGGKASVHLTTSRFSTSTDCIIIKPKSDLKIDASYVFQYFRSNMQVLVNGFKGAGLKHISKAYLSDIEISYPEEIGDQRRIANLLEKVEGLIGQRKQHLQHLDDFLKSVFLEMFGDPVRNEKGWDKPKLKAFGKISTGNTPPRNDPANYGNEFIEWIKTDNIISDSPIVTVSTEYLSEEGVKRGRTVSNGALLVACIAGSIESIGRAALTNRTVAFNQQINAIQPAMDVNPVYLYALFKLSRTYIQSHATKGMKKIITKGDFEQILMIKPPLELQNKFAIIVEKINDLKTCYLQSLADLEDFYGALSQKAFKGELDLSRVPLPTSALGALKEQSKVKLERIKEFFASQYSMSSPNQRIRYLKKIFEDTQNKIQQGELSTIDEKFWSEVELDSLDYMDDDGETEPDKFFSPAEYDEFKKWVFEAIKSGKFVQHHDEENTNRIVLKNQGS